MKIYKVLGMLCSITFLILIFNNAMAQKSNTSLEQKWLEVQGHLDNQLPQSAVQYYKKEIKPFLTPANKDMYLKAQLFELLIAYEQDVDETYKYEYLLSKIQEEKDVVTKAIWHNIAAQVLKSIYNNNSWEYKRRTQVAESISSDVSTWNASNFRDRITYHFLQSVAPRAALQAVKLQDYTDAFTSYKDIDHVWITLYDMLAAKATGYLEDNELDNSEIGSFEINDDKLFCDAFAFVQMDLSKLSTDHNHSFIQSLKIYQAQLQAHFENNQTEALIFVDLDRLYSLYEYSKHEQKSIWYYNALKQIVSTYPSSKEAQTAKVDMLDMQYESRPQSNNSDKKPLPERMNMHDVVASLQQVVHQYPNTNAANKAHDLLEDILDKELKVSTEQILLPNQPNLLFIEYKNISEAYLMVYSISSTQYANASDSDEILNMLAGKQAVASWKIELPQSQDYESHSTESILESLPFGQYVMLIGDSDKLDAMNAYTTFQVSNISVISHREANDLSMQFLHRKSGKPLPNVQVKLYERNYNNKQNAYVNKFVDIASTSRDGALDWNKFTKIKSNNYYNYHSLYIQGDDTLVSNVYDYANGPKDLRKHNTSHIFTDRAIYRPGQQVAFKGIVYSIEDNPTNKYVVPNEAVEVTLYDANYQKVKTLKLRTNEFGSYQGVFELPTGLLNGHFSINDGHTSKRFRVEEYKRPKFFIQFDTISTSYALNQQLLVKGKALAYAGNPISNAAVKYKISRDVYFPYYYGPWRWMPSPGNVKILKEGTIKTNDQGEFDIPVDLLPDLSVDKALYPNFNFKVSVDVTDINGETHDHALNITTGYAPYKIDIALDYSPLLASLKKMSISTRNYSGAPVQQPVNITISKLQYPGYFIDRYWEMPDVKSIDVATFKKHFPLYAYGAEGNMMHWKDAYIVQSWTNHVIENDAVDVNINQFKDNGFYKVVVQDPKDTNIKMMHVFYVHDKQLRGKGELPMSLQLNQQAYAPGDKLALNIVSNVEAPAVFVVEKNHLESKVYKEVDRISRTVEEADRGGIVFHAIMIRDNRVYEFKKEADVAWTNKELQIEWASHRDKLLPGSVETWTLKIRGKEQDKVAAEVMSVLYDASLDALTPHSYNGLNTLYGNIIRTNRWTVDNGFQQTYSRDLEDFEGNDVDIKYFSRTFPSWQFLDKVISDFDYYDYAAAPLLRAMPVAKAVQGEAAAADLSNVEIIGGSIVKVNKKASTNAVEGETQKEIPSAAPIRTNFNETAYFIPQMQTNAQGEVEITFTIPESLTEWKMMSVAHTKDMRIGYLDGKVKTQKDIMVQPNMPRYFRQNDQIILSSKLVNMTDAPLQAQAHIQLLDPETGAILDLPFQLANTTRQAAIAANGATEVHWELKIPESRYKPVIVRISAQAGNHTDGEEHVIPVLTNRTLVTETMTMPMTGSQSKSFKFQPLLENKSTTISHKAFTFEFTSNPAWYAVQALPYLKDYPYDCAEQLFSKLYANAIAQHIITNQPGIINTFKQWQTKDSSELSSKLQQNESLKSTLLQETPWVMEAEDEAAQKRQIAQLFDKQQIQQSLNQISTKLINSQNADGGWSWFPNMPSNTFITQYIATGYGKLKSVKAHPTNDALAANMKEAVAYLDRWLVDEFDRLKKYNKQWKSLNTVDPQIVNYFYMRSYYKDLSLDTATSSAYDFYYKIAKAQALKMPLYSKAQMAIVTNRKGDNKDAKLYVQSLQETAQVHEELGMYWKNMPRGYYWYEAPIETQALIIEAFQEVSKDSSAINLMKTWLIKQKQTQHWATTKATTDAVYALLLSGDDWLATAPTVTASVGDTTIIIEEHNATAGTGYFLNKWSGTSVDASLGTIQLNVKQPASASGRPSWGAAYWQYFEDMDKVTNAVKGPLSVSKEVYLRKIVNNKEQLVPLSSNSKIQIGDRVTVRIIVKADRDMEYIHLKDMRAAAFEPVDVLSGYQYNHGIGAYLSISDASMNYFFDRMNKGTYVFEYDLFANAKGEYSNGITTIQCMYAPEFTSHTNGIRLSID